MIKFLTFFAAALALQGVLAAPLIEDWRPQIQDTLSEIELFGSKAASSIQNASIDNDQSRRHLVSQANEFANSLQTVIYNLQLVLEDQVDQQPDQQLQAVQIQQSLRRLTEIAYSIQLAINADPSLLHPQLQLNIQNSIGEARNLAQIAPRQTEPQQRQLNLNNNAINEALGRLLVAVERIHLRERYQNLNHQELSAHILVQLVQVTSALQNVDTANPLGAQVLADQTRRFSSSLGRTIAPFERQRTIAPFERQRTIAPFERQRNIAPFERQLQPEETQNDTRNVVHQILTKLHEIRGALDQGLNAQRTGELKDQVAQLRDVLSTGISGAGAQLERLVELVSPSNDSNQGGQNLNRLIRNRVAEVLAFGRNLLIQLRAIGQNK